MYRSIASTFRTLLPSDQFKVTFMFDQRSYNVLQKYARIGLKQNLFRSTTLDIITRLLDNVAFLCVHVVGRSSKDFSEVRELRRPAFSFRLNG